MKFTRNVIPACQAQTYQGQTSLAAGRLRRRPSCGRNTRRFERICRPQDGRPKAPEAGTFVPGSPALLLLLLLCLSISGCTAVSKRTPAAPPAKPQRIVSIAPSVTEMLYAVGAGDRVVATDDYSDYPPEAKAKPHVGGVVLNYERIVGLKPDLVIGFEDLQGPALERLRKLGLNVLSVDTTTYNKTVVAIHQVGGAVGEPDAAKKAADRLIAALNDVQAKYAPRSGASVLAVAQASPTVIAMGRETFLDDLLTLSGGINAAPAKGYAPLSRETLARVSPDLVLVGSADEGRAMRERFAKLPGKDPRIVEMPPDILVRPGPRLGDGLIWLARTVHGESSR